MYRFFKFANRFIFKNFQKFSNTQLCVTKPSNGKRLAYGATLAAIPLIIYNKNNDTPYDLFLYRINNLDLDNREHIEQLKKLMLLIEPEIAASYMFTIFLHRGVQAENKHPAIKELLHHAIQNTKDPENTAGTMLTDFALDYGRFYKTDCKSYGYIKCMPTKHNQTEIMEKVKLLLSYNVKLDKKYHIIHKFGTKEKSNTIQSMFTVYTAACDTNWTNTTDLPINDAICKYIRPFYLQILDHNMQKVLNEKKEIDVQIGHQIKKKKKNDKLIQINFIKIMKFILAYIFINNSIY